VIVHVMCTDVREHYDLEGLWGDAPVVRPPAVRKSRARQSAARPGPRKRTTRT